MEGRDTRNGEDRVKTRENKKKKWGGQFRQQEKTIPNSTHQFIHPSIQSLYFTHQPSYNAGGARQHTQVLSREERERGKRERGRRRGRRKKREGST
jgi:hypothetical protein